MPDRKYLSLLGDIVGRRHRTHLRSEDFKLKTLTALRQFAIVTLILTATTQVLYGRDSDSPVLRATTYDSHFPAAAKPGEAYNGMGVASDGTLYYVLSSKNYDVPGQMYSFNPKTKAIIHIANLNDATGQGAIKAVAQGKSHVTFIESKGKLYFSTHLGYYKKVNNVETTASVPDGYLPYPGGHFLSYDMHTGKFADLATAPGGQGIVAMTMDVQRGRMYGLTWPGGHFLRYDLASKELKDLGTFFEGGETGTLGSTYRVICRRIVLDPRDGSAYFTTGDGAIHRYRYDTDNVETVAGVSLRRDYFGVMNPAVHSMAYNWRAAVWVPSEHAIYGINGRSGYLFRFDPSSSSVEVLERLTSEPSKKLGMRDESPYGYLGLVLGADGHTLYYFTGAPLVGDEIQMKKKDELEERTHLITYDISSRQYVDHGPILLANGDPVGPPQGLALGLDGTVYGLTYVREDGKNRIELISVRP